MHSSIGLQPSTGCKYPRNPMSSSNVGSCLPCLECAEFLWSLGTEKSTPVASPNFGFTPHPTGCQPSNLPTSCPTRQQHAVGRREHTSLPLCALPILALDQTNAQLRSHRLCTNTRTAIGTDDHSLPGLSTCRNPSGHLLIQVGGNSSLSIVNLPFVYPCWV
jgi:hypothetical protein